jgi:hypothetical protein
MTWGQELANILGATGATGISYLNAIESAFQTASIAGDLQTIAKSEFNGSTKYGQQITGGVAIQSLIDCAVKDNYMQP